MDGWVGVVAPDGFSSTTTSILASFDVDDGCERVGLTAARLHLCILADQTHTAVFSVRAEKSNYE